MTTERGPEPKVEADIQRVAVGRREWTIYVCPEHGLPERGTVNNFCEACGGYTAEVVRVAEVGESPEEERWPWTEDDLTSEEDAERSVHSREKSERLRARTDAFLRRPRETFPERGPEPPCGVEADKQEESRAGEGNPGEAELVAPRPGGRPVAPSPAGGLSREEIEALLALEAPIADFRLYESARAKLRAYLGQENAPPTRGPTQPWWAKGSYYSPNE